MAITINSEGKADFVCEHALGFHPVTREVTKTCGWFSRGWDNEEQAQARADQHANEHETGELMPELVEFEQSVGFERAEA